MAVEGGAGEYLASSSTATLQAKLDESSSKRKPKSADCLDLQRLWEAIREEMFHMKKELLSDRQESCADLRSLLNLTDSAAKQGILDAAGSLAYAEAAKASSHEEVESVRNQLSELERCLKEREDAGLESLGAQLKVLTSEVEQQGDLFGERLVDLGASGDRSRSMIQESNKRLEKVERSMDKAIASVRADVATSLEESSKQYAVALARQKASILEQIETLTEEQQRSQADSQRKLMSASDAAYSELQERLQQAMSKQKSEDDEASAQLRYECKSEIGMLHQEMLQLSKSVSSVANLPTRRVEWVVRDASPKLQLKRDDQALQAGEHVTISSKPFEVAGSRGLQFELVRFGGPNVDNSDRKDGVLRITAEAGLTLVFRLSVGEVVQQLEHTFDGEQPFSTCRLCMLSDQIRQEDDTLRIGLEVLEAFLTLESSSSLAAIGMQGLDTDEAVADTNSFIFHRYVNHRMLDLVQNQVDVMNSRMTRRVEWRIDGASRLAGCFSEDEAMCSATFQAAGLDGLQLVFYPCGSAGVKEGYCSCFVIYPGKSALRCWLSVGNQRREAKLFCNSAGFFGRTNFCRLENGVEAATDSLLVTLEIDEAQQDVIRHSSHQTIANQSPVATTSPVSDGTLTLQRASGHLQEVKQLPSIWTPTPHFDISSMEGFHSITDLSSKKKKPNRQPETVLRYDKVRPGTISTMSMCSPSDGDPSRPESRQRPRSRVDRGPSPERSVMKGIYSEVSMCPPATARPVSTREVLSARYAAYRC